MRRYCMKAIIMSRNESEDETHSVQNGRKLDVSTETVTFSGRCGVHFSTPIESYKRSDAPTGIVTFGNVLGDKQNSSMTIKEGIFSIQC